jgi:WD40 repeat protein
MLPLPRSFTMKTPIFCLAFPLIVWACLTRLASAQAGAAPAPASRQETDLLVEAIAFSADGKLLAAGAQGDGSVRIWEVGTKKELRRLEFEPETLAVKNVAFTPDGKHLIARPIRRQLGILRVWNISTGNIDVEIKCDGAVLDPFAISPDSKTIVACEQTGQLESATIGTKQITLRDLESGTQTRALPLKPRFVAYHLAVSPTSATITAAGCSEDLANRVIIRRWSWESGEELPMRQFEREPLACWSLSFDGANVAIADATTIWLYDVTTGEPLCDLKGLTTTPTLMAFSPNRRRFVALQRSGPFVVWDVETGAEVHRLTENVGDVESICMSPDGTILVAAIRHTIRLWDLQDENFRSQTIEWRQ